MAGRTARYAANRDQLVQGMTEQGFTTTLLPGGLLSPIITTFRTPLEAAYSFATFHCALNQRRFMIYTGKVTDTDTTERMGAVVVPGHFLSSECDTPEDYRRVREQIYPAILVRDESRSNRSNS